MIEVGDFIMFNAVKVSNDAASRIKYMATAMVVDKDSEALKAKQIPDSAPVITEIEQVTS